MGFLVGAREAGEAVGQGILLFDPVPGLMSRVANRHRMQLLVQSASRPRLQAFLDAWVPALAELPARSLRWSLDVDPLDV
jgi:primosomal protein N' (replication factor Y)